MRALVVLGCVSALTAFACTTTSKGIEPEPPRSEPSVPPSASAVPVTSASPPVPPLSPVRPVPNEVVLGAPCQADDPIHCGTRSRVAVMIEVHNRPLGAHGNEPCKMDPTGSTALMESTAACVQDERVYVTSECTACRTSSTWSMVGIVAEMTDPQLLNAQSRMGLAKEPLLHTPDAWRGAIAHAAETARARRGRR
jgi:hypothetical protein